MLTFSILERKNWGETKHFELKSLVCPSQITYFKIFTVILDIKKTVLSLAKTMSNS